MNMDFASIVRAHWDLVRFVTEDHLKKYDGSLFTLSVTDGTKYEFMIFLGKQSSKADYEVRVYKNNPEDKYIPHESDEILRYESNDEYATFYFDNFIKARNFVELLGYFHPEYKIRPVQEYKKSTE